jgi:DNA mismatch endonuclease (patch repair protein)
MPDIVSPEKRSQMMAGIRGKNTKPEILIRKALHRLGFRYRLHVKGLPGTPDMVLPKYNAVIFIHGCFWHLHQCSLFKWPSTRPEFWQKKLFRNRELDEKNIADLLSLNWRVAVVWECALRGRKKLNYDYVVRDLYNWLNSKEAYLQIKEQ